MNKFNKNNFYGKFSTGASFYNTKDIFFSKKNISHFNKRLIINLKKMNFTKEDINNKVVMDVGSGRQALGFLPLNTKKIYHYDISKLNVKKFNKYIYKNKLNKKIISKQLNLVRDKLPKEKFDFIYLHGIIQHTERVNLAIKNLCSSLKINGSMWFYFYRPGSFNIFLTSLQRKLIKEGKVNINKFHKYVKKASSDFDFVDSIMDDCFAPNCQLFYPKDYSKVLSENSCMIFGNTFLTKYKNKVNFKNYHQSATFFLKKNKKIPAKKNNNLLNREHSVNVLNKKLYKDKNIKDMLNILSHLSYKKNSQQNLFDLIISIEKSKRIIEKSFLNNHKLVNKKYINIIKKLKNKFTQYDKLQNI